MSAIERAWEAGHAAAMTLPENKAAPDVLDALTKLEKAATVVHRAGASPGAQWAWLSLALIEARAALAKATGA